MNWFENALATVAPGAALKRAQYRIGLDVIRQYEAAKHTRATSDWIALGTSANAEIGNSFRVVRNRVRQMVRDNEYMARGLEALVTYTVGTGIIGQFPDQALFERWSQECDYDGQLDFSGLTELHHRTRREAGESLVRLHYVDPDTMEVPLKLQVLEPDHLDDSKTVLLSNGNFVLLGKEYTPTGQCVAYWLFPQHPGEVASWTLRRMESERVPANEILHYYRKRRPSQVRGISEFGTSIMRARNLGDYQLAEIVRKKTESCFVAFVRTDDPNARLGAAAAPGAGGTSQGARTEKLAPGMIKYIGNSEGVTFGAPASAGGYGEFNSVELHAIAAGIGCTYEMMTGDHSQLSFSGGRLNALALRPLIESEQWLALAPMYLNPVARAFQVAAKLAGKQRAAIAAVPWTMPRVQLQDILKEALGIKELIRGGLLSLPEGIRQLGYDPTTNLKENAMYLAECVSAGVAYDTDPMVASKLLTPEASAKIFESLISEK